MFVKIIIEKKKFENSYIRIPAYQATILRKSLNFSALPNFFGRYVHMQSIVPEMHETTTLSIQPLQ